MKTKPTKLANPKLKVRLKKSGSGTLNAMFWAQNCEGTFEQDGRFALSYDIYPDGGFYTELYGTYPLQGNLIYLNSNPITVNGTNATGDAYTGTDEFGEWIYFFSNTESSKRFPIYLGIPGDPASFVEIGRAERVLF